MAKHYRVRDRRFFKSSYSGGGNCVEVAMLGQSSVIVRHSRCPDGGDLTFSRPEWQAFVAGVKDGEFDLR